MPKEIKFLDNILHKEDSSAEKLNDIKRRLSISRSGRYKSKNKQREALDTNLFSNPNVDKNQSQPNNSTTHSYSKPSNDHSANHTKQKMVANG